MSNIFPANVIAGLNQESPDLLAIACEQAINGGTLYSDAWMIPLINPNFEKIKRYQSEIGRVLMRRGLVADRDVPLLLSKTLWTIKGQQIPYVNPVVLSASSEWICAQVEQNYWSLDLAKGFEPFAKVDSIGNVTYLSTNWLEQLGAEHQEIRSFIDALNSIRTEK